MATESISKRNHDSAINDALGALHSIHAVASKLVGGESDGDTEALVGLIWRESARARDALDSHEVWHSHEPENPGQASVDPMPAFRADMDARKAQLEAEAQSEDEPLSRQYQLVRRPDGNGDGFDLLDLVCSLSAIGHAISDNEDDYERVQRLAGAVKVIAARLEHAVCDVDYRVEQKVEHVLAAPDTEAEKLMKRLRGTDYMLCTDPQSGYYGLLDGRGKWHLWIVGLDAIEDYLREKGVELNDAA